MSSYNNFNKSKGWLKTYVGLSIPSFDTLPQVAYPKSTPAFFAAK